MRPGPLIGILLAVGFAVAFFVMRGNAKKHAHAAAPDAAVARETPTAVHRAAPDARGAFVAPPDAARALPTDEAELASGLTDAHAHLQDLVAPCLATANVSDATVIKYRYQLIVAGGTAHAADALITEASEPIVELVACITDAIGTASWPTQLPDLETPVEDALVVGELR